MKLEEFPINTTFFLQRYNQFKLHLRINLTRISHTLPNIHTQYI